MLHRERGQWDTDALFVARLGQVSVFLEPGALVLQTRRKTGDKVEGLWTRFRIEGAEDVVPVGVDELRTRHNFIQGRSGAIVAESYERAIYPEIAEGVDLQVRLVKGRLEYDLILAPGARLSDVRIRCEGVNSLSVAEEDGSLVIETDFGPLLQSTPISWSVLEDGVREKVDCQFVLLDEMIYGFRLGEHDPARKIVVDPEFKWATYLGGSGMDTIHACAIDPEGLVVVGGVTESLDPFSSRRVPASSVHQLA